MNKLIGAAAVLTTGFALVAQAVDSDIVGYDQTGLRENGKICGVGFVQIASETGMDITKITVTGYDPDEGSSDEVDIQILDSLGRELEMYYWNDYYKTKSGVKKHYVGWVYDGDFVEEGAKVFAAGEGIWVDAPSTAYKLVANGKVMTSPLPVTLRENGKLVGNPYPVEIDLTKTWVSGYDPDEGSSDEVDVQVLDSLGRETAMYYWNDYYKTKSGVKKHYVGWVYDGDFIEEGSMVIQSGEAVWVDAPSTSYVFNFPGILDDQVE